MFVIMTPLIFSRIFQKKMFHNPILMSNRTIDKGCDVRWTVDIIQ